MSETIIFNTEEAVKTSTKARVENIAIFKLISENDPLLKTKLADFDFSNPPVHPNEFASALVETCKAHKGYGLSANQCGFPHRVFVMGAEDEYVAFFNPKVIEFGPEVHMAEGCLSFPMLELKITRPAWVKVEYQDYNGELKTTELHGISARCFLHELDHMNGILYTSRAKPLALQNGMKKRSKVKKLITKFEQNMERIKQQNGDTVRIR